MATSRSRTPRDDAPLTASRDKAALQQASQELVEPKGDALVGRSVTINRPRDELYRFWRHLPNLPAFMDNVERIDVLYDDRRSHWVVKAPAGRTVEWDVIITEDRPGEMIAWASEEKSDVQHSGRIDFRDAGTRGTVVTATLLYDPPAGKAGKLVAKLFQREPAIQARRDLRRFKQLMEAGEVATAARTRAARNKEME